jgi:hemin uptake protein HemP
MSSKPVLTPNGSLAKQVPRLPERPSPSATSTALASAPRMLDSSALMGDQALVLIQHQGEIYRLQTTRQGKLILTK